MDEVQGTLPLTQQGLEVEVAPWILPDCASSVVA